jgi:exopolysaccharide production protein ExoQ
MARQILRFGHHERAVGYAYSAVAAIFLPLSVLATNGTVLLVIVLGICGACRLFARSEVARIFQSGLVVLLGMLAIWAFVSCFWSPDPMHSLVLTVRLVLLACAGLTAVSAVATLGRQTLRRIFVCALAGGGVALLILLGAVLAVRVGGVQFGPDPLEPLAPWNRGATVLAAVAFPAAAALWTLHQRLAALLTIPVLFALLIHLASDAAILAVCVGSAGFLVAAGGGRAGSAVIAVLLAAVILLTPTIIDLAPEPAALQQYPLKPSSSGVHRLIIWGYANSQISERPFLGLGMDASRHLARGQTVRKGLSLMPLHPHNGAMQIRLELGLPGVLITAAIFVWLVVGPLLGHRSTRLVAGTAGGAICAYFVVWSLSYGIWQNWWVSVAWLVGLLVTSVESQSDTQARPPPVVSRGEAAFIRFRQTIDHTTPRH